MKSRHLAIALRGRRALGDEYSRLVVVVKENMHMLRETICVLGGRGISHEREISYAQRRASAVLIPQRQNPDLRHHHLHPA